MNFLLLALAGPVPTALVAFTVQVYFLPGVRPLTVIGLAGPVLVFVFAPFLPEHVTAYDVTGLPPLDASVKVTLAFFGDVALAEVMTGAPGAVAGAATSTVSPKSLKALVPIGLVAETRQW